MIFFGYFVFHRFHGFPWTTRGVSTPRVPVLGLPPDPLLLKGHLLLQGHVVLQGHLVLHGYLALQGHALLQGH